MARKAKSRKTSKEEQDYMQPAFCTLPQVTERPLADVVDPNRAFLIRRNDRKWVNHTVLHFAFLDEPALWRGSDEQKEAVRNAFETWKGLGIGLVFTEVDDAIDAEIRIGFEQGGSWSYIGRDSIDLVADPAMRTMNFGWDLTTPYGRDTALHEIGHALGFPHEHQNPNAGIVWDEPAVIQEFSGPPNSWSEGQIRHNILNKIAPHTVEGSDWDRDSIMHYQFGAGLILEPSEFRARPLIPESGLSQADIDEARRFYPAPERPTFPELRPWESHRVRIDAGEQLDFVVKPTRSREYTFQTFGALDTVLVLFEEMNGEPRYYDGDDDSGFDLNARVKARLFAGRRYFLRLRLYFAQSAGEGALMMY